MNHPSNHVENNETKPNEVYKQLLITSLKNFPYTQCKFKTRKSVCKTKYFQAPIDQYFIKKSTVT